jgi:hypothetical protein
MGELMKILSGYDYASKGVDVVDVKRLRPVEIHSKFWARGLRIIGICCQRLKATN